MHLRLSPEHLRELAGWLQGRLRGDEEFSLWLAAEDSDFVRFNHARVRQATRVLQIEAQLRLIRGARHASLELSLTGTAEQDRLRLQQGLEQLRGTLEAIPEDPYLLLEDEPWTSVQEAPGRLPEVREVIDQVDARARDLDLVGIYAGGPLYRGFANTRGSFGWQASGSASLDWSLFADNGEAVKTTYAARDWDAAELGRAFARAREQLEYLQRPQRTLQPGAYRAYLAPAALEEIVSLLCWGGFSARELATRQSPLLSLHLGHASLSPQVRLEEAASSGLEPLFDSDGFLRRDQTLIDGGRMVGQLVSPRSAKEFGLPAYGAGSHEMPRSLVMAGGDLPEDEVLARLGTGLYIGNLWYLNYSDLAAARITGMTRFASFWVEDGRIVAPLASMRFDTSLYSVLGEHLQALTRERSLRIDTNTYGRRSAATQLLPGALVEGFTLTL
ncbi:TldD/PmbA family protein [Pseudomonas delhiensis]|uniref:TldD/PmbA family protein n=1 Tax=Pseudomonas delhiensis TaxID=366289 RepID=UPI00315A7710